MVGRGLLTSHTRYIAQCKLKTVSPHCCSCGVTSSWAKEASSRAATKCTESDKFWARTRTAPSPGTRCTSWTCWSERTNPFDCEQCEPLSTHTYAIAPMRTHTCNPVCNARTDMEVVSCSHHSHSCSHHSHSCSYHPHSCSHRPHCCGLSCTRSASEWP